MQDSSSQHTSLEEYLNLDLIAPHLLIDPALAGESIQVSNSLSNLFSPSRLSSDDSPQSSTTFLPNTPLLDTLNLTLNQNLASTSLNPSYFSNIEDLYKSQFDLPTGPPGEGAFSFADLFASSSYSSDPLFNPLPPITSSSTPVQGGLTIDPQLTASKKPKPSLDATLALPTIKTSTPTTIADDNDDDDEDDDEDDEDDDMLTELPMKGGKASKARKPSVNGGGVAKRPPVTSCVVRDTDSNDPDDWRPTPEEYKKLSSKEKRQLRNKISARNFRVRRKEYITTLESQISDRDKLIGAIRDELGAQKLENAELRQEIDNLKKAMLEGRVSPPTGLPPPSSEADISIPTRKRTTPLAKANPNKDVSATSSFWGGNLGMGGITPVHSVMLPDLTARVLSNKGSVNGRWNPLATANLGTLPGYASRTRSQENINPQLNVFPSSANTTPSPPSSSATSPVQTPPPYSPQQLHLNSTPTYGLGEINPFTIKTLDSYRLQLWAKMAAAGHLPPTTTTTLAAQQYAAQNQSSSSPPSPPSNTNTSTFTNQLRPAFFSTPPPSPKEKSSSTTASGSLSAILAGKTISSLSSIPSSSTSTPTYSPAVQTAAQIASASLVSRMSSAFWEAFASPRSGSKPDTEKFKRVLEGKAVLRVVDLDEKRAMVSQNDPTTSSSSLEEKMRGLTLSAGMSREDREVENAGRTGLVFKSLLK